MAITPNITDRMGTDGDRIGIDIVDPCRKAALSKHPPLDGRSAKRGTCAVRAVHCGGGNAVEGLSFEGTAVFAQSLGAGRALYASSQEQEAVFASSEKREGVFAESESSVTSAIVGVSKARRADGMVAGIFGTSAVGEGVHGETGSAVRSAVVGISTATRASPEGLTAGIFGKSEVGEGVHGETSSDFFAAVAGIQLNERSPGAGIYGKHAGNGPAGFFEGNVVVTKDIALVNGDCAEDFDLAAEITAEPGTVMVLDGDGRLLPSSKPYDRHVAGIVSGAGSLQPAIILDRKGRDEPGRVPVALVGKVFCKVDARPAPIAVGDLLTTSATEGHAMKAEDPARAFGAVIGKALRPLPAGAGLIPVLVALQ